MGNILQDLRWALRIWTRQFGLGATIVATLGLGIGVSSLLFCVVNTVLLRGLPYASPDQLAQVWEVQGYAEGSQPSTVSPFNYLDWVAQSQTLERSAVYRFASVSLLDAEGASRLIAIKVSRGLFPTLGARPVLGRVFESDEPESVVLSYGTWQKRFEGDPHVVGKSVTLDGIGRVIVGVMPPEFNFPSPIAEVWMPPAYDLSETPDRSSHYLFCIGRLKPHVTVPVAQLEFDTIARRLELQYPESNRESRVRLVPLQEDVVGRSRRTLVLLFGAACVFLLAACLNVATLLTARWLQRRREVLVRTALGATRARVVQQILVETAVLVACAGLCGLVLTSAGARLLSLGMVAQLPRYYEVRVDGWVVAFAAAVCAIVTAVVSIAPVLRAASKDIHVHLRSDGRAHGGYLGQSKALVVFQGCAATTLLIGAGLLAKSEWSATRVELGFRTDDVLTMQVSLAPTLFPDVGQRSRLLRELVERVKVIPGVAAVGGVNDLPFSGSRTGRSFAIDRRETGGVPQWHDADYRTVAGEYFPAMGIPLLKGRAFGSGDTPNSIPVAIINRRLATQWFGKTDPLGRRLIVGDSRAEVVGVVGDVKHDSATAPAAPEIYVPLSQGGDSLWLFLVVRGSLDSGALVTQVRRAAGEVVPQQPIYDTQSMRDRVARSNRGRRFSMLLVSLLASLGLVLSAMGVYGVTTYSIGRRRQEICGPYGARGSEV